MSPLPQTLRLVVQPSTTHHHQGRQKSLVPDGYTEVPPKVNLNPMPLYHRSELRPYLAQPWELLASYLKKTCPQAHHHCPFCHQWLIQPRGLRAHIKAKHQPLHASCATAVASMQEHRKLLAL